MKPSFGIVYFRSQLQGLSLSVFACCVDTSAVDFCQLFLVDLPPSAEIEVK